MRWLFVQELLVRVWPRPSCGVGWAAVHRPLRTLAGLRHFLGANKRRVSSPAALIQYSRHTKHHFRRPSTRPHARPVLVHAVMGRKLVNKLCKVVESSLAVS